MDGEPGSHGHGVSRRRVLLGGAAVSAAGVAWVAPSIQSAQAQPPAGTPVPVSGTLTVTQNNCSTSFFTVQVSLIGTAGAAVVVSRSVDGGPFVEESCVDVVDGGTVQTDISGTLPVPYQVIAELVTGTCAARGTVLACQESVVCIGE